MFRVLGNKSEWKRERYGISVRGVGAKRERERDIYRISKRRVDTKRMCLRRSGTMMKEKYLREKIKIV